MQTTQPIVPPAAPSGAACCPAPKQAVCCDAEAKPDCCGTSAAPRTGCACQ